MHEMLTNALRHAYFDSREGEIRVELTVAGRSVSCTMSDTGSLSANPGPGRGLKLVADLVKDLGRNVNYVGGAEGSAFTLVFPLAKSQEAANRSSDPTSVDRGSARRANGDSRSAVSSGNRHLHAPQRGQPPAAAVA